ncbi:MAG: aldehyde dehydrogenase family protein [Acidimicrobiia bacterium]|nr:aldehyde dehydrogenase family protein [Acidimicrobiia bacterium]
MIPVDGVVPVPICGEPVTTGETIEVRAPYDGTVLGRAPACGPEHVDRAVAAGRAALEADDLPTWRRAEILDEAARLLAERHDTFARTIALESAKPIRTARGEADRAVSTFQFAAAAARTLVGEMVPLDASAPGEGRIGFTLRVPIGVIGAISPFNFPLNLVAHKLAPAIAAGCPVVLKPASQTPFSAIALARLLLEECGLPPAWLHVVTGGGSTVGNALVEHEGVAMVSFTGSAEVGWSIRARAPRKKVGLELGNNAPVIIEADGDWKMAADKIQVAGYAHAGQSCISTQRVYVQRSIAADFQAALAERVGGLVVGDPLDEATDVSALISPEDRERVRSWVGDAVAGGARLLAGGQPEGRAAMEPTLLAEVTADMAVSREEVFGPVVGVAAYDTLDEALALANDTAFGLQAAVFTADLHRALHAARHLDYGGVLVNEVPTWRADQMPYGGVRDSGNTREGPAYSVREMTESRLVVINP